MKPAELVNCESKKIVGVRGQIIKAEMKLREEPTILEWMIRASGNNKIKVTQYCGKGSRSFTKAEYALKKFPPKTQVLVHGTVSASQGKIQVR